jgi:hypothetical protein
MVALAAIVTVAPGAMVTVTPGAMVTLVAICCPLVHVVSAEIVVVAPPLLLPPVLLPVAPLELPAPLLPPLLEPPELLVEAPPPLLLPPVLLPVPLLDPVAPGSWWYPEPGTSGPVADEQPEASARMESATVAFSDSAWRNMRQTPRGG